MDNERLYSVLCQFIKLSGWTNKRFAEAVSIPQSTFQTMLKRKNDIKTDVLNRIGDTMSFILQVAISDESENASKLLDLYKEFLDCLSSSSYSTSSSRLLSVTIPPRSTEIADILKQIYSSQGSDYFPTFNFNVDRAMFVSPRVETLDDSSGSKDSPEFDEVSELDYREARILAAFDKLNELGQDTLIERAEELLLIDKYRKGR